MPFDGTSEYSHSIDVLRQARGLIQHPHQWTTRAFHRRVNSTTTAYCAMGAIAKVLGLEVKNDIEPQGQVFVELSVYAEMLYKEIPWVRRLMFLGRPAGPVMRMFWFNDGREHRDVLHLFDRAIAKQQSIHNQMSDVVRVSELT